MYGWGLYLEYGAVKKIDDDVLNFQIPFYIIAGGAGVGLAELAVGLTEMHEVQKSIYPYLLLGLGATGVVTGFVLIHYAQYQYLRIFNKYITRYGVVSIEFYPDIMLFQSTKLMPSVTLKVSF